MLQLFRVILFQKEQTLLLAQMYFKTSLLELRILLLGMGLVEDPMGLQLQKEMYLLVTISVKQVHGLIKYIYSFNIPGLEPSTGSREGTLLEYDLEGNIIPSAGTFNSMSVRLIMLLQLFKMKLLVK